MNFYNYKKPDGALRPTIAQYQQIVKAEKDMMSDDPDLAMINSINRDLIITSIMTGKSLEEISIGESIDVCNRLVMPEEDTIEIHPHIKVAGKRFHVIPDFTEMIADEMAALHHWRLDTVGNLHNLMSLFTREASGFAILSKKSFKMSPDSRKETPERRAERAQWMLVNCPAALPFCLSAFFLQVWMDLYRGLHLKQSNLTLIR